jgi:hypothetical protein
MREAAIIAASRTPVGKYGGACRRYAPTTWPPSSTRFPNSKPPASTTLLLRMPIEHTIGLELSGCVCRAGAGVSARAGRSRS